MLCPFCTSEISPEAVVCKVCTRDVYLFKPMMAKVLELEERLAKIPSSEDYQAQIAHLEALLESNEQKLDHPTTLGRWALDIGFYLIVPLLLLLLAHWLITVVYDTKMVYLRIISMSLPLPFGYFLFKNNRHKLFPWFIGAAMLSIASVIGMSAITSAVDHSPIFPQNIFELKEVIEYSASIAFSFLTGMLLGGVARLRKSIKKASLLGPIARIAGSEGTIDQVHGHLKRWQEYGGTVVALGTTALSIYTGLKGIIGS